MSDVTEILSAIERGDTQATEKLLPVVYEELRKLVAEKLGEEKPGQTLQATYCQGCENSVIEKEGEETCLAS